MKNQRTIKSFKQLLSIRFTTVLPENVVYPYLKLPALAATLQALTKVETRILKSLNFFDADETFDLGRLITMEQYSEKLTEFEWLKVIRKMVEDGRIHLTHDGFSGIIRIA